MEGKLDYVGNFEKGKRNGIFKEYYENGVLKGEVEYKNDIKDGIWRTYYENGQLELEGEFRDNKRKGKQKKYDENGKLIYEEEFYGDLLHKGRYNIYNEDEQLKSEFNVRFRDKILHKDYDDGNLTLETENFMKKNIGIRKE